jgi:hypothetical protein
LPQLAIRLSGCVPTEEKENICRKGIFSDYPGKSSQPQMNTDKRGYSMRCRYSPVCQKGEWPRCINSMMHLRSSAAKAVFRIIGQTSFAFFAAGVLWY